MRVLLISANREEINMPALPVGMALTAAAAEAAGHEVVCLDMRGADDLEQRAASAISDFDPEVVGLSVRNIDDQDMTNPRFLLEQARIVARACRRHTSAPLILGGAGYSIFPEAVLAYLEADAGVAGEGETTFPLVLDRIQDQSALAGLPGVYLPGQSGTPGACLSDLGLAPWEKAGRFLDLAPSREPIWLPFQTRRGCPLACAYCSTPTIEGRGLRKMNPKLAAERLAGLMDLGATHFFMVDNTFNLPPSHAKAFCRALTDLPRRPTWRAIVYPGAVDEELVSLMARAGCVEASLGFESGSMTVLKALNKRFTPDQVRRAADLLARHDLRVMGFLMLGGPGETRRTVEESVAFVDSLPLAMVKITMGVRIYPHTALAALAVSQGRIPPGDDLLTPRFYLAEGLEDWLPAYLKEASETRGHWV